MPMPMPMTSEPMTSDALLDGSMVEPLAQALPEAAALLLIGGGAGVVAWGVGRLLGVAIG